MFGFASFAQTPFASLAGNLIALSLAEGIGVGDASTQLSAYGVLFAEDSNLTTVSSEGALFFESITEATIVLGDSNTQAWAFLQAITEASTLNDPALITAQFAVSEVEDFASADTPVPYFALLESIVEGPSVMADSNSQAWAFRQTIAENFIAANPLAITAQFPLLRTEASTVQDITAVAAQFATAVTEPTTMGSIEVIIQQFFADVTEALTSDDARIITAQFAQAVFENLTPANAQTIRADFATAIAENVNLLDNTITSGWIKIIDSQIANWASGSTDVPAGWATLTAAQTPGWSVINDNQASGWAVIADTSATTWTKIGNSQ
jgi:hypothetical protein